MTPVKIKKGERRDAEEKGFVLEVRWAVLLALNQIGSKRDSAITDRGSATL